ncbi:MAG TPA: hypothetical protein DCE03_04105 [Synergistaceae bacterium]|jgi:uncharacterized membrane protein HdeD (DUF308 family)|nr:MAG: Putative membrane protein [Synergistales bacterium 54_9]MDK2846072.1 hypothetical protein [Synergistales bacterium]MDN5335742.1 hypothetical protein [Synergistales bacterium]HAA47656.1 hypothetical protein [Synergistaceae bacterium]HAG22654.1 hypothetical protein [Synergistaceae bacterium]
MFTFDKIKQLGYFFGIVLMILGAVFIVMPERIIGIMTVLIGAILLAYGLFRTIAILLKWTTVKNRVFLLALGLASMAAGTYILLNTQAAIRITGIVLGIFALLLALDRFVSAHRMRGQANILPAVMFGFIHLAFAAGLIYSSMKMFSFIVFLYGFYLFASGVMVVLSIRLFKDF